MSLENQSINLLQIKKGVTALEKRVKRLNLLLLGVGVLFFASSFALYIEQDFVYYLFGLNTELQQLHIPVIAHKELSLLQTEPNYFSNLLSWITWFIFKLVSSIVLSFFVIRFLAKFLFFKRRFKSFSLKVVAWFIAFILLWTGLSFIQDKRNEVKQNSYSQLLHYEQNIQQSQLAQHLKASQLSPAVQAYLLAQTALMHQPPDKNAAIPYVLELVRAEQQDSQFFNYGFNAEQIWKMQHQLYNRALTPLAQPIDEKAKKAENVLSFLHYFLISILFFTGLLMLSIFLVAQNIKKRLTRIEQKIF